MAFAVKPIFVQSLYKRNMIMKDPGNFKRKHRLGSSMKVKVKGHKQRSRQRSHYGQIGHVSLSGTLVRSPLGLWRPAQSNWKQRKQRRGTNQA